ncbi:MAG TPA: hypothetical protein GX392_08495 [Clostridiales bacterium]|nr:hypothetical protein [Clostridiales bacterium]
MAMREDIKERWEMIQRGEVPEGYKKTKVGIIPEDWEVKKLGTICDMYSGGTPRTSNKEYYDGKIPWINSGDLNQKKIQVVDGKISDKGLKNSSAKMIEKGDLLIALYGATAGVVAISNIDAAINQAVLAIIPRMDSNIYIYYQLDYLKESITNRYTQGGQPNLSAQIIKSLPMSIPLIAEQQKIADILSAWDEAIDLEEKLIEEKQEQKKGLMQNLLTGKVRLPGFEGEWEEVKLGKVINECKVRTSKNNQYPILTSSRTGIFLQNEYFSKQVASTNNIGYKIVKKGYFTYRTMSDDGYFKFNRLEDYDIGIVSPAYVVFRATKINPIFLQGLINSYEFNKHIIQVVQGGTRLSLRYSQLKDIKVKIPSIQEQKAIADVLSTVDREIELLKEEVELLKEQKKGLMQLLLTGIVRVDEAIL